jgi:hypothetical protein
VNPKPPDQLVLRDPLLPGIDVLPPESPFRMTHHEAVRVERHQVRVHVQAGEDPVSGPGAAADLDREVLHHADVRRDAT